MRIKQMLTQHRRDFTATLECDCGHEGLLEEGYDDDYYHQVVIPSFICPKCGEKEKDPKPQQTKYPADQVV
jgi:C4-type Zn-finger protein